MPTKPGDPFHEVFNAVQDDPEEDEEELPEINIDVYLHGEH